MRRAQIRADQSAKAALKGAMRALQGLANEQQLSISEMQEDHDNPDVWTRTSGPADRPSPRARSRTPLHRDRCRTAGVARWDRRCRAS